jgi:hypothetical protein
MDIYSTSVDTVNLLKIETMKFGSEFYKTIVNNKFNLNNGRGQALRPFGNRVNHAASNQIIRLAGN